MAVVLPWKHLEPQGNTTATRGSWFSIVKPDRAVYEIATSKQYKAYETAQEGDGLDEQDRLEARRPVQVKWCVRRF